MRITKAEFKNFKRFTNLTLDGIPVSAKLVLLIGANGSGKSSVFDAFHNFGIANPISGYFLKNKEQEGEVNITLGSGKKLNEIYHRGGGIFQDATIEEYKFIGRSSIRIVPRLSEGAYPVSGDSDRPGTFIDPDTRFMNDVFSYMQEIDNKLREPVFRGESADTLKIFRDFIQPLNDSLLSIFGSAGNTTIQISRYENFNPGSAGKLIFSKGAAEINYDLLSHGEKQVVILLLNFIVRKEQYNDAIIFIDEMDCHLNTSLQHRLLEEVVMKWIPDSAQLWTASHALGFIDYARKSDNAIILDFDNLDFDIPQYIEPMPKDNIEVYEIAIPKPILFDILKGKRIVLCENQNDEYYNLLQLPDTIFVGLRDARDLFLHAKRDNRYTTLRDRDFISDLEIRNIQREYPHHRILHYYDFENYLYHPDNLAELNIDGFDVEAYRNDIRKQKKERQNYILPTIGTSRQGYEEFKANDKIKEKNLDSIIEDLVSDDFERFYKYFDMKSQYRKNLTAGLNIDKKGLVCTSWFRRKIADIIAG